MTGVVDAVSYLHLGHVFVANMTGNVVFLGFALAGASGLSAATSAAAIAAFLLGAFAGGALLAAQPRHRGRILRAATTAQAALLALTLLLALVLADPAQGAARYALLVPLALAMGVQNNAAQRLNVPDMTTTVLTKTLTGLAGEGRLAGGGGARPGRRLIAVGAMLAGAVAGGLLTLNVSVAAALALALAVVLLVAAAMHALSRGGAAPWASEG